MAEKKKQVQPPLGPRYSGDYSRDFWDRVQALPERKKDMVYALGCALQDLEHRALTALHNAEASHG